jgi:hypothetical protein
MIVKHGADHPDSSRRGTGIASLFRVLQSVSFRPRRSWIAGFTAAELLVATAIGAVILGAAALTYSTVTRGQRQFTQTASVSLPDGALSNFYGGSGTNVFAYIAPNLGSVARAESMRERFLADIAQAVAVYCLYRADNVFNTFRPATIPSPAYGVALDTPEAFRAWLATEVPASAPIFTSYRNTGVTPNISIFVLGYSGTATTIPVLAVYDMDLVQATNPNGTGAVIGTHASVRRYVSGALTAYYDVVYPVATGQRESWSPPVVAFERRSRLAVTEGATTIDRFKVAAEQPFYFIFWPDPAEDTLALPRDAEPFGELNGTYATTDPRRAYNHMAGRTSFMFTVPMFPSS